MSRAVEQDLYDTEEKTFYFNEILLYIFRLSQKSKRLEFQKKIHQKVVLAGHRKTHQPEKEFDVMCIVFHLKIEQTIKKAATKVVNEKFY